MAKGFDSSFFIKQFKEEADEHIQNLNQGLMDLEHDPENKSTLDLIFREAHTLKGSANMMGFTDVSNVAHAMEDLLDRARTKKIKINTSIIDILLESLDFLKEMVEAKIENKELSADPKEFAKKIRDCMEDDNPKENPAETEKKTIEKSRTLKGAATTKEITQGKNIQTVVLNTPMTQSTPVADTSVEAVPKQQAEIVYDASSKQLSATSSTTKNRAQLLKETIRVEVKKLDLLLNLVGELIIGKSRLDDCLKDLRKLRNKIEDSLNSLQSLKEEGKNPQEIITEIDEVIKKNLVLREDFIDKLEVLFESSRKMKVFTQQIQEGVMQIRMLPLSTIFSSFNRYVRDASKDIGKKVRLEVLGGNTELDKRILDEINDPLIHLIRNSIDHGIETPAERIKEGKPEEGVILINAYARGSQVIIEISDDGKGLNLEVIKKKAIQKSLISAEEVSSLSAEETINFIFNPGFSTKESVSLISGRGVGMDVVKSKVESLSGILEIENVWGQGCKFIIKLPLTLSLNEVLMIKIAGQAFAVPLLNVEAMIRLKEDVIMEVGNREVFALRDKLVPLIRLHQLLGLRLLRKDKKEKQNIFVMLVGTGDKAIGFIVDEFIGKQEIVIKNLGDFVERVDNIAGATILGSGDIVPILDLGQVLHQAKTFIKSSREEIKEIPTLPVDKEIEIITTGTPNLLAVEDSLTSRELLRNILEAAGYNVDTAVDGADAWEKITQKKYDLIVSDLEMPRMDGFELLKKVRSTEKTNNLPLIIVTTRESDKKKGMDLGANEYLIKSNFDQKQLLDSVKRLTRR